MSYNYILSNPYIVGNPIKSEKMFFGREDDFRFIRNRLLQESKGIIITIAGERRSGKTSVLFQIMNGRLGAQFMPFFIDMQTMVDVNNNREFLQKIEDIIRKELFYSAREKDFSGNGFSEFEKSLREIQSFNPGKKILLMFDEYELMESKFEKGTITDDMITFFAGMIENFHIYMIFTGSHKIQDRDPRYWRAIFGKAIYRNISFLNKTDTFDLITKPLEGYVYYTMKQTEDIYRLTSGQPFYTQIFCQNIVDKLIQERRNQVVDKDVHDVIDSIINHPIPQMIYFWNELPLNQKILLSIMADVITGSNQYINHIVIRNFLYDNRLGYLTRQQSINSIFEELFHLDILRKTNNLYQFRIDIFRYWIKQDQNIWKILHENNLEKDPDMGKMKKRISYAALSLVGVALSVMVIYYLKNQRPPLVEPPSISNDSAEENRPVSKEVTHMAVQTPDKGPTDTPDHRSTVTQITSNKEKEVTVSQLMRELCPANSRNLQHCGILETILQAGGALKGKSAGEDFNSVSFVQSILAKRYASHFTDSTQRAAVVSWTDLKNWMTDNSFNLDRSYYSPEKLTQGDVILCSIDKKTMAGFSFRLNEKNYLVTYDNDRISVLLFDSSQFQQGFKWSFFF